VSVVVVGSVNVDITVPVARPPAAGQTLLGGDAVRSPGGKGANQAVAAARLGRAVRMVGAVGRDPDGDHLLGRLRAEGVDVGAVVQLPVATGQAFVFVSDGGESTIVVAPGANMALRAEDLDLAVVAEADVLLLQQEIPADVVAAAAATCQGTVVLNPAPARPLDAAVLSCVDLLVPNRDELAALAGVDTLPSAEEVAAAASALGVRGSVVVTLGAGGAVVVEPARTTTVPALAVDAVDATAAGDSFCAGLADALLSGADLVEATRFATRVAAVTVTRPGAIDSLPTRSELPD
jgi:ribokinase